MTLISNTSSTKKNVLNIEIAGNGFAHHQLKSNRMERESDPGDGEFGGPGGSHWWTQKDHSQRLDSSRVF